MLGIFLALLNTKAEKKRFEELYHLYKSTLYNYAYQILQDEHLSEDAVDEAFLSLSRNMDKTKDRSDADVRNYLIVIAKNRAYRMLRERNHIVYVEDVDEEYSDPEDVEIEICGRDIQERVLQTVRTMDDKYADVIMLKYRFQMNNAEIANELGITLDNVKIRLHRARKFLQKELEKEGLYSG